MTITIKLLSGEFLEPEFSQLQRAVFASVQDESAELARMLDAERARVAQLPHKPPPQPPVIRFGAYANEQLVGWSYGWFERGNIFYMANSGVLAEHRRQGIYTMLINAVITNASMHGAMLIRSQHSVLNNAVIICKLKHGFRISGLSTSAQMGTLVELTLHISDERGALFESRVVPLVAPEQVSQSVNPHPASHAK